MKITAWEFYKELRHLENLSERRLPMFDKNRFVKILIYFMFAYYAAILVFLGVTLPEGLDGSMSSFHMLDSGFIYLLTFDFWCRFLLQQTPAQKVQPFSLLPIRRGFLMNLFLARSALSWGNLFWGFFLIPFGFLSIVRFYGFGGLTGWLLGWWLLVVANSLWYLFCRTLILKNLLWVILPVVLNIALVAISLEGDFIPDYSIEWLEQFIFWNPLAYLPILLIIALLFYMNHKLQSYLIYKEVGKVEETNMKRTSEIKFLNRYGVMGEYLKLEVWMRTRNKAVRTQCLTAVGLIIFYSCFMSWAEVEEATPLLNSFFALFNYQILGMTTLGTIMQYEGNYIDGLMSRRESIYDLLKAKYYFNLATMILPLLLMTPTMVTGRLSILMNLGYMFFVAGTVFPTLFQLAAYNNETLALNKRLTAKANKGGQMLISMAALIAPLAIEKAIVALLGDPWGFIVLIAIGLVGICTHPIWLKNIYHRFMSRRYKNMEGFRATRENN